MSRKFGVELEMVGISREQALRALRLVGITVQGESYNHTLRDYWKIVPDGSVIGGFEIVSPILQGEAGLEQLRTVVTALDDMGGKVNRSCGYHVHFDASDLNVEHLKAIVLRYAAHEQEIDSFMPRSRRGNNNTYCESVVSLAGDRHFQSARTLNALVDTQPGRYFKVNLQSYHVHGTVEFRQHSGTLNAPKAVNWVRLLDAFITETKRRVDAPVTTRSVAQALPALRGVSDQLASMFQSGPVSLQAMCERFGWQRHSARAAVTRLRRAGLNIVCQGHGTNMYILQSPAQMVAPEPRPAVTSGSLFDGVAECLKIFYRNRAAILNAA